MGFTLASRKVTSISECVRKEMITYVEYTGPSPKQAITYPQYLIDEDKSANRHHDLPRNRRPSGNARRQNKRRIRRYFWPDHRHENQR